MRGILFPTTDAVVLAQTIAAVILYAGAWFAARRNRDARFLIGAMAFATFAFFGLRAAH